MYDIQVQSSEVTILLTLHSRFSTIFIEFLEVESYGVLREFLRDVWYSKTGVLLG